MNSAPPVFTTIVSAFVLAIVCGRWWLVNETLSDRVINRALTWDIGAVAGYAAVAGIGYPDVGQRVFMAIGFLTLSNTCGFIALLGGADQRTTWQRQRAYDSVAASAGVLVLLCAVAGEAGLFPAAMRAVDWDGLLWVAVDVLLIAIAVALGRACIRELRTAAATTGETLTYWALLAVACYTVCASAYRTLHTVSGASPRDLGAAWAVGSFAMLALLAALISMPLVSAVLVRAGLDRESRWCRRLHPLWHDLTTAVPEVVLPPDREDRRGSSARLYRMTVEIRDALLHLKQYVPDPSAAGTSDLRAYARDIAAAARLKRHGTPPANPGRAVQFPAGDRTTELSNLLALSRAWVADRSR
ncbi:MAB_1171c family putative transporter [Nocardia sp. NPDC006044]|uniref:MAB_1171c family putative transporter n=1 Tax=Nocardia sp. NPDC006044 TaxID=3364306 RepID=UPI0036B26D7D